MQSSKSNLTNSGRRFSKSRFNMNSVVQNHVEIIGVSQSEPHTNHSYKRKLYLCMCVFDDTSSTCSSCSMRVCILQLGKNCQHTSYAVAN